MPPFAARIYQAQYRIGQFSLAVFVFTHSDKEGFKPIVHLSGLSVEPDSLCQKPDSIKKIEAITAGILRKNYKFVCQLEEMESRVNNLTQRMNHAKEQFDMLKFQFSIVKPL